MVKEQKVFEAMLKRWMKGERLATFDADGGHFVTAHDEMRVLVVEGDPEKHMQVLGYIIPAIDRPN